MQSSDNKFVVEEIEIPDNQMQQLNKIVKSFVLDKNKSRMIRAIIGGSCSACYNIPSIKVSYDVGEDFKLVDYYCSSCFDKHKKDLDKRLDNMNFA